MLWYKVSWDHSVSQEAGEGSQCRWEELPSGDTGAGHQPFCSWNHMAQGHKVTAGKEALLVLVSLQHSTA